MRNPFKRPEARDERWKLLEHMRPHEVDQNEADEVLGIANEYIAWSSQPFHARFLAYLERKATEPVHVAADHLAMVSQATRCDVYREIITWLRKERNAAKLATGGH